MRVCALFAHSSFEAISRKSASYYARIFQTGSMNGRTFTRSFGVLGFMYRGDNRHVI